MKKAGISVILGFVLFLTGVLEAELVETEVTCQGRLMETNKPSDGFGLTRSSVSIIVYLERVDGWCKKAVV